MVKKAWETAPAAGRGQVQRRGSRLTRKPATPVARPAPAAPVVSTPAGPALPLLAVAEQPAAAAVAPARPARDPLGDLAGWLGRHWWETTPVAAAAVAVAGCHAAPGVTGAAGAVASGALGVWAWSGRRVRDRMWLSGPERRLAATWTGAVAWAGLAASLDVVPAAGAAGAVVLATMPAGTLWVWSRRVRTRTGSGTGTSPEAAQIIAAWPGAFAADGPAGPLHGSTVVPGSMLEPAGGFAFAVQLRDGVHSASACVVDVRRALERAMRMPPSTARLTPDPDDAAVVRVELTPGRALQRLSKPWPGPATQVVSGELVIPLAVDETGRDISAVVATGTSVEHLMFIGTSGAGKSNTSMVTMTPGAVDGLEVVIAVDGKKGQSGSRVAAAFDRLVSDPKQFGLAVECVHGVMKARQDRYGLLGRDQFDWSTSADPILTLLIEEAAVVKRHLTARQELMVSEIALQGRGCGVRLIQVIHDPRGIDVCGEKVARDALAGNGTVVAMRPGGGQAGRLAVDSTSEEIDLTSLPDGPGWAVVLRRGQVLSRRCRVLQVVDVDGLEETLAGVQTRTLTGADLQAAGDWYSTAITGAEYAALIRHNRAAESSGKPLVTVDQWLTEHLGRSLPTGAMSTPPDQAGAPSVDEAERALTGSRAEAAEAAAETRRRILEELDAGERRRSELADAVGVAPATVTRALSVLAEQGLVESSGGQWRRVQQTDQTDQAGAAA